MAVTRFEGGYVGSKAGGIQSMVEVIDPNNLLITCRTIIRLVK